MKSIISVGVAASSVGGIAAGESLEGHSISISTLCVVACTVGPLVWLAAGAVQKLKDEIAAMRNDIIGVKEQLDHLPCHGKIDCPKK